MPGFTSKSVKDGLLGTFLVRMWTDDTVFFPAVTITDGAGNKMPAMDAAARPGFLTPVIGGAVVARTNPLPVQLVSPAPTWVMQTGFIALAQNKLFFDLFNAVSSGKILRVKAVTLQKDMSAQTGVPVQFNLNYTTAVGTGGNALTPVSLDNTNAALPAQVTARSAAAGGAGLGSLLASRFLHSEETNVAAQVQEAFPFWPVVLLPHVASDLQDIVLREGQGLTLKQITATTAGVYNVIVVFTVEGS